MFLAPYSQIPSVLVSSLDIRDQVSHPYKTTRKVVGLYVQAGSTRHVGHSMAYCTCPGWLWWWRNWWNEDWQGKPKYSEETCSSATWSTTNPTWPDLGSNPGRRCGKPATNRLSYGAAVLYVLVFMLLDSRQDKCSNRCLGYCYDFLLVAFFSDKVASHRVSNQEPGWTAHLAVMSVCISDSDIHFYSLANNLGKSSESCVR
jgi:hypothetical protein